LIKSDALSMHAGGSCSGAHECDNDKRLMTKTGLLTLHTRNVLPTEDRLKRLHDAATY